MRLAQHPAESRQQTIGIDITTLETDQDPVFMRVTTKTRSAAFNQIRQLQMIERATSPAQNRR
jgi:hypothetical protein